MEPSLFLNSLRKLYLSFFLEPLDNNHNLIYISVLWLLLLLLYFLVRIPSTPMCCENEHTQKHRGRAKRRRKGGTLKGSRYYYHRKEEKNRRLNSIKKSPLGQRHDTTHFHQRLCPDPSCEVCNNTTTELSRLPLSEALEDSLPSVSSLASTAALTEPSFTQSPASSADPPGDLIPPPLPEALPPAHSVLLPNPGSPLGDFLSPSPSGQTLPSEPFPPSESKFPVHHPPPQPKDMFSSNLSQCDFHQEFPAIQSTKTSFAGHAAAKLIDPGHLFLSPDEHDSLQQYPYPKIREDHLKQKLVQLFWGLPSLHSESLPSAVHVLDDYSSTFIFNSISNASKGHESPMLPYFLPPNLLELQPESLPQTLPQSQPLPPTQLQPQAHLKSSLPVLSYDFIPKNRACGMHFHGPQNESGCLTISDIQRLEWNVLQRKQESWKGLCFMVQKSREDFCPSAPTSPQHWPSKGYGSISTNPVEFPLGSELQEKFELHLRKRLIQHRWCLPLRIHKSLSLMRPPNNCSDICESKSSYGLSRISVSKGQCSQPGSFYGKGSEMFQLKEDEGMDEGHRQESDPKDLLNDSESSSDKDVGYDSQKDLAMMSLSEENSVVSGQRESPRQWGKALQVHLSKVEEISDSQLPRTLHDAWHAIEKTPSVKSDNEIKQRRLPPSVNGDCCLNTSQKLSFLQSGTQQMMEAHITKLRTEMLWGLPAKVLESIEIFQLKDTSSHSLFSPQSFTSTNLLSQVNSKSGGFKPLRGSCTSLHGEKVGTENSATVPTSPLPATSLVGKEGGSPSGERTLRQSPSHIKYGPVEEVQTIGNARQTLLPITNSITSKASQQYFPVGNIHPSELPTRQAGAGHEPEDKNVNSSDRAETQLVRKMEEKAEPASMSSVSRETVKAEELSAVQYKTSDSLTANKPGISQRISMNETKGTTDLDPKSSDFNNDELKSNLEKRKKRQTQGQPTDISHETNQASLPGAQGVSSVDMGASQVLHVHLGHRSVSVEQQQKPSVPKQDLRLCPVKNFPPALKNVSPTGSRSKEFGAGDAGLVSSQPGRNRLEETVGSKSPQTLSQKRQSPPDNLFINKMKNFIQRLQPRVICTKHENPQVRGSPSSSAQSRGPVRSRVAFMGTTETQKAMSDIGKFPEDRLWSRYAGDSTCPQEPPLWAVRLGTTQQRPAVRAWMEPFQRPHLNPRAPSLGHFFCRPFVE